MSRVLDIHCEDAEARRGKVSSCLSGFAILAICLLVVVGGCTPNASAKFSSIYRSEFDPEKNFRTKGYTVQTKGSRNGVENSVEGYAWTSWQGVITAPEGTNVCVTVAEDIRDTLNAALKGMCHDELTNMPGRSSSGPLWGLLQYNKDGMHGNMHVWLIPDESETKISYVIFLREERMKH